MTRRLTLLGIAGGMLLLLGLGVWLITGDSHDAGEAGAGEPAVAAHSTGAAPAELPAVAARPIESRPAPAHVAAAPPPAASESRGPPESYRRALGGLTGRVVQAHDAAGKDTTPVAGLRVQLAGGRSSSFLRPIDSLLHEGGLDLDLIAGEAVTDEEGRFLLAELEPRTAGVLLLGAGGPRATLRLLEITPTSGQVHDLGDIVLALTATLKGEVVDERGAPIEGVRVRAGELPFPLPLSEIVAVAADYREGGALLVPEGTEGLKRHIVYQPPASLARYERLLPVPTTFTDAEGRFTLEGVQPGLVALGLDHLAHLPLGKVSVPTGAAGGERDLGRLVMGDGLTLLVTTEDERGRPVAAATVLAGNGLGFAPVALLRAPVRPPATGPHEIRGLRPGEGWVAARVGRDDEFTVVAVPDMARGTAVVRFPVPRRLTLSLLGDDETPIAGARLFARPLPDDADEMPDFVQPPQPLERRTTSEEPGVYVVEGLQPSRWEIVAVAAGFGQVRETVDLVAGDASAELRLPRGAGLAVRVVQEGGAPVEHARLDAFALPDTDEPFSAGRLFRAPVTSRLTDAQGRALLADLPPGRLRLRATHPGLAITSGTLELAVDGSVSALADLSADTLPGAAPEVTITLPGSGSLFGVVLEDGAPPDEPLLVILDQNGSDGDGELPRFTLTDFDGEFHFENVEPGSADVAVRPRMGLGGGPNSFFATMFETPLAEGEVEVRAGEESSIVLVVGDNLAGQATAWVSGQLFVNGRATEGWTISTWGKVRRVATTDESGRFDLGRVAAGESHVQISGPDSRFGSPVDIVELTLEPDERRVLDLRLETGAVAGRVLSAIDGRPLGGISISASDESRTSGWRRSPGTVTDQDGRFRIEPIGAGSYRLEARGEGWARTLGETFTVSGLQERSGLELRMNRAAKVSGTLAVQGLDEAPSRVWLLASPKSGPGQVRASARADVDRKDGIWTFEFDDLSPGEWMLNLASTGHQFAPQTLVVTGDMSGLRLVFEALPPGEDGKPQSGAVIQEGSVTITIK